MASSETNRYREKLLLFLAATIVLAALATLLLAAATPGTQFQVNTFTSDAQRDPSIASDAAGNFVIVWASGFDQDGSGRGIFAQRFNATGASQGPEFQVNTFTTDDQLEPSVAMDAAGNFVVAWTSVGQDGDSFGVFAQRYDASGARVGTEFPVNITTAGNQSGPAVAMNGTGNFVIAWLAGQAELAQAVVARRFDADGVGHDEFTVNTSAGDIFDRPAITMEPTGNFLVAWTGVPASNPFVRAVLAQRFDSTGAPQGAEFQINALAGASKPSAGMDQGGNFVVAWQTSNFKVRAQRFNASGGRMGSEFQVNTFSSVGERPAVAMNSPGQFIIAGLFDDGESPHIFAQTYSANGTPEGDEIQVNNASPAVITRRNPAAAIDPAGNFVITWTGRDSSSEGIFARRYQAVAAGISVSINDVSVVEGDTFGATAATFTVTLSAASNQPVTVGYATADGTATATLDATSDYAPQNGTVTFPPGVTSQQITVQVNGDTRPEPDETFFVNLGSPSGASILRGRGIGTIVNDDFTISVSDAVAVTEGNTGTVSALFTVGLSGSSNKSVSVHFATADGTATVADNDYAANSGTLTFAPGETGKQITVLVNGDMRNEFTETFFVNLSNPINAPIADGQATGTIRNDDFAFSVPGNQFQVNFTFFGNQFQPAIGMNAAGSFVITWTGAVTDSNGFITGTGIFAQRFDSRGIIQGPELRVDDPSFVSGQQTKPAVALDAAGNFVIVWNGGNVQAATTDPNAICSICNIYAQRFASNGNREGTNFQVNTSTPGASLRDHPSVGMYASGEFVVAWRAAGAAPPLGSGTGIFAQRFDSNAVRVGNEFLVNPFAGSNHFNPVVAVNPSECVSSGSLPVSCSLQGFVIVWEGAGTDDPAGIYARRFEGNGAPSGADQFRVNMYTDNIQEHPAIAMDAAGNFVVAWEGEGLAFANGPVVRGIFAQRFDANGAAQGWCNPLPPGPISCLISDLLVNEDTTNVHRPSVGGGKNGDFVVAWDGFHLPTSQNSAIFGRSFDKFGIPRGGGEFLVNQTFPLGEFYPDVRMDAGGNFAVTWVGTDSSIGGVFARRFATAPTLSIGDFTETEGDAGTVSFTFPVTLSQASSQLVTVNFGTADGAATLADNDYLVNSGTLTFAPGDTSKNITVTVNGDNAPEPDETFFVNLGNATNAVIGKGKGVGTILNDDCTLSINDVSVAEGNSGTVAAAFTVSLPCPESHTVTVNFSTSDGTATLADNDYQPASGALTFLPGETSKNVTILINGDTTTEPDETFFVNLSNATNAPIAKAQGVGTITNDEMLEIVINETITVTDTPSALPSALIGVAENITVADAVSSLPSAMIGVAENITVADAVSSLPAAMIGVAENITVSDSPQLFDTGAGTNVVVKPVDRGTGASPVTLTFANVLQAGNSSLTISGSGPAPPAGFAFGNPLIYYDLSTTAVFSGNVTVCINYSGIAFSVFTGPRLFHFENGVWVDRTLSVNTTNTTVCGIVTSLSPFALFEPVSYGITLLYDPGKAKRSGSTLPIKIQITDAAGNNQSSAQIAVTAVRIVRVSDDSSAPLDDSGNANPDLNFRFDATLGGSGGYIFNLSTKGLGSGTYRLFFIIAGDPVEHFVPFQLR